MAAREAAIPLRLVNAAPAVRVRLSRREPVTLEPARPAALPVTDARWVLAVRVRESLDGGSAAILPPEARARMLSVGRRLGLRPFDINLVIAIVQDHVRCGGRDPHSEMVARLALVPGAAPAAEHEMPAAGGRLVAWAAASVVLACVLVIAAVSWLNG